MLKNILVATDFSQRSDYALQRAVLLAKAQKAHLHLVHIIDGDQTKMVRDAQLEVATNTAKVMAEDVAKDHGLVCTSVVKAGTPHITLAEVAHEVGADLIVMGAHRKHFLKDAFIGTTVERLIKSTQHPVLLTNLEAKSPYTNAILATDFSDGARHAARTAFGLAVVPAGHVTPIHVFDPPLDDEGYAEAEAAASRMMHSFLQDAKYQAERGLVVPMEAPVADLLVQAAEETQSEVMIVGNRGQRGSAGDFLKQAFLGSIAQEVLGFVKQDVLVIPLAAQE